MLKNLTGDFEIDMFNLVKQELQPVYENIIKNNLFVPYLISKEVNIMKFSNSLDGNIIKQYKLKNTESCIINNCKEYLSSIKINSQVELYVERSWLTYAEKGQEGNIHAHNPNCIAGVLYFNTLDNDSCINFHNPRNTFNPHNNFTFGYERESIRPVQGLLLLFPGWLMHSIDKNTLETPRSSLSFQVRVYNGQ